MVTRGRTSGVIAALECRAPRCASLSSAAIAGAAATASGRRFWPGHHCHRAPLCLPPTLSCALQTLKYWDLRTPNPVHTQNLPERVYAMDCINKLLVVGTADRTIQVGAGEACSRKAGAGSGVVGRLRRARAAASGAGVRAAAAVVSNAGLDSAAGLVRLLAECSGQSRGGGTGDVDVALCTPAAAGLQPDCAADALQAAAVAAQVPDAVRWLLLT